MKSDLSSCLALDNIGAWGLCLGLVCKVPGGVARQGLLGTGEGVTPTLQGVAGTLQGVAGTFQGVTCLALGHALS